VLKVPLTKDKVAKIDDEDLKLISSYSWRAQQNQDGRWYAMAWTVYPYFLLMHRIILCVEDWEIVDHIDNDGLNNQRSNLRVATYSQNVHRGIKTSKNCTSLFKGVHFENSREKWKAIIKFEGQSFFLGRFDSEVEAAKAYDEKARELYGEFAFQNFGDEV
jgi:hypothetical protein